MAKPGDVALLGVEEVARRLGLCAATVKSYADGGVIPVLRDSARRRLFFSTDVEAFKAARKKAKRRVQTGRLR